MEIKDLIEKVAKLDYLKNVKHEDVTDKYAALKEKYDKGTASEYEVAEAVVYMVSQFAKVLEPTKVANAARYDLIVRSLEKNRVLSKDVLESIKKQLDTISKEEQGLL